MIPWLAAGQPFPDVSSALRAPNGLLAASSELTTEHLIAAYETGRCRSLPASLYHTMAHTTRRQAASGGNGGR